mmetsp:Transcript_74934/g.124930  ORF Transcript_74934/g.124930 Transcript_74934/m.124930 type:complete len:205 (+) Transcript_74934:11-625(+)
MATWSSRDMRQPAVDSSADDSRPVFALSGGSKLPRPHAAGPLRPPLKPAAAPSRLAPPARTSAPSHSITNSRLTFPARSSASPRPAIPSQSSASSWPARHVKSSGYLHKRKLSEPEGARFSDDEDEDDASAGLHQEEEADWEVDGFEFSGVVCADESQPSCNLCGKRFKVSWDHERNEIVVTGAVMLRHVIYHTQCANARMPPT